MTVSSEYYLVAIPHGCALVGVFGAPTSSDVRRGGAGIIEELAV